MWPYAPQIEQSMKTLYHSLREKDQRRYAAVEATKLGHGGIEYISRLLGCDPKTIHQGLVDRRRRTHNGEFGASISVFVFSFRGIGAMPITSG